MNSKQFVSSSASLIWDQCTMFKEKLRQNKVSKFWKIFKWPTLFIMNIPMYISYYTYPAFENYTIFKIFKRKYTFWELLIGYLLLFILLFGVQAFLAYQNEQFFMDLDQQTKNFCEDWVDILNYTVIGEAYIILGFVFLFNVYNIEQKLLSTQILTEKSKPPKFKTNLSSMISAFLIIIISIFVVVGYMGEAKTYSSHYWFMAEGPPGEVKYSVAGYYYFLISLLLMMMVLWVAFAHFGLFKISTRIAKRLKNDLASGNLEFWRAEDGIKSKLAPLSWLIVISKSFVLVIALNLLLWKFNEPNRAVMYDLSVLVVAVFGIWVFSLPRYYIQYYYFKINKRLGIEAYKDLRIPWVLGISSAIDIILVSLIIKTLISEEFTFWINNFFS